MSSGMRTDHGTHINKPCCAYEIWHTCASQANHGTCVHEPCHEIMAHVYMSHVTHAKHGTHMHELWHAYKPWHTNQRATHQQAMSLMHWFVCVCVLMWHTHQRAKSLMQTMAYKWHISTCSYIRIHMNSHSYERQTHEENIVGGKKKIRARRYVKRDPAILNV